MIAIRPSPSKGPPRSLTSRLNLTPADRDKSGTCRHHGHLKRLRTPAAPYGDLIMRFFALAGAFVALAATLPAATPADAAPFPTRYCAQYKGGAENCGFYSFAQCLAALSGNGGMCFVAPMQTQVLTVHTP